MERFKVEFLFKKLKTFKKEANLGTQCWLILDAGLKVA